MTEAALRRLWIVAIAILVAVIVFASLTPSPVLSDANISDKGGHYLAYLMLALMGSGIAAPERLWRAMLRCFLLGAALEVAQALLTSNRAAEWGDLLANVLGVLTAWVIAGSGRAGWGIRAAAWLDRRRSS